MRGVQLFMFVVAIPTLVALGHDGYLFYTNPDMGFQLATLGFIWTHYHPESYKWAFDATSPEGYWPYINTLLSQKAAIAGAIFAGFFYVILAVLKLLGLGPFTGSRSLVNPTGNRRVDEMLGGKKPGRLKYKRK